MRFPVRFESQFSRDGGVVYSGKPVKDWDGWKIVDLETLIFDPAIPLKFGHSLAVANTAGKAAPKVVRASDGTLSLTDTIDVYTELGPGQTLNVLLEKGHPLKQSIGAYESDQTEVIELGPGDRMTVNGREVTGPLSILRGNRLQEITVTEFPIDRETDLKREVTTMSKENKDGAGASASASTPAQPPTTTAQTTAPGLDALLSQLTEVVGAMAHLNQRLDVLETQGPMEGLGCLQLSDEEKKSLEGIPPKHLAAFQSIIKTREARLKGNLALSQSTVPAPPTQSGKSMVQADMERRLGQGGGNA